MRANYTNYTMRANYANYTMRANYTMSEQLRFNSTNLDIFAQTDLHVHTVAGARLFEHNV